MQQFVAVVLPPPLGIEADEAIDQSINSFSRSMAFIRDRQRFA
ncbi:MAG: hypothetical protein ACRDQ2_18970 [Gaiellales bacterium]